MLALPVQLYRNDVASDSIAFDLEQPFSINSNLGRAPKFGFPVIGLEPIQYASRECDHSSCSRSGVKLDLTFY